MPTVGEVITKVSELQSRWAILHELVTYLETHYRSSDAGPAELKIKREDYAVVPEEHIDLQLTFLVRDMDQILKESAEWEKLKILEPGEDSAKPKPVRRKRKRSETARQHTNQPSSRNGRQKRSG